MCTRDTRHTCKKTLRAASSLFFSQKMKVVCHHAVTMVCMVHEVHMYVPCMHMYVCTCTQNTCSTCVHYVRLIVHEASHVQSRYNRKSCFISKI